LVSFSSRSGFEITASEPDGFGVAQYSQTRVYTINGPSTVVRTLYTSGVSGAKVSSLNMRIEGVPDSSSSNMLDNTASICFCSVLQSDGSSSCSGGSAFNLHVGDLIINGQNSQNIWTRSRFLLTQAHYILPLEDDVSIEVRGAGLSTCADRIMVIDCRIPCGSSNAKPTSALPQVDWMNMLSSGSSCSINSPPTQTSAQAEESWHDLLQFGPLQFRRSGQYNLCFCQGASAGGAGGDCSRPQDYALNAGSIQITGIPQVLLQNVHMSKTGFGNTSGQCESLQPDGGLYCHADDS